jgi:hypothetical protein
MVRKFACAAFALLVCVGVLVADEMKGKVAKVDADKGMILVKVEGKEKPSAVKVGASTKFVGAKKLADVKEGDDVTITYEGKGKDKKITEIKVGK